MARKQAGTTRSSARSTMARELHVQACVGCTGVPFEMVASHAPVHGFNGGGMESRRIVVTMGRPEERDGFFLPQTRRGEELELAQDLGEALRSCLARPCERLYVSLFSADPAQLTSLSMFRTMRPEQYIILVVDPSVRPLVEDLGLADECLTFEA